MQVEYLEKNIFDYVEKIIFLEKVLGKNISYKILDPFEVYKFKNDLNQAAKFIAKFAGLNDVFAVSTTKLAGNIGGNIEYDGDVCYIEINNDSYTFDNILAILSHEIMHQYLRRKGLSFYLEIENEVLTDIATIYTGLGKLSLNGVYSNSKKDIPNGTLTIKNRIGYIDFDSFCFVYLLICQLRKLPETIIFNGLNLSVRNNLKQIENSFLYQKVLSYSNSAITDNLFSNISRLNATLKNFDNVLKDINNFVTNAVNENERLKSNFTEINNAISSTTSSFDYNPILNSLNHIKNISDIQKRINSMENDIAAFDETIKKMASITDTSANTIKKKRKFSFFK